MNNLFLINETFTNGYISNILDIISILAVFCGILVIVNKNPIISVLFLFILMLINIRISELQSNTNNSIPLTIFIGISLSYSLFQLLPYDIAILNNFNSNINKDIDFIINVLSVSEECKSFCFREGLMAILS